MERLASLGINRTKVTLLAAIANLGGTARTSAIVDATGVLTSTVIKHLKELEGHGYVEADVPTHERRPGVRITWSISTDQLNSDLQALKESWTPSPRPKRLNPPAS